MSIVHKDVVIPMKQEAASIRGALTIPPGAKGIVVFAHGSGSGRFSPRNQMVASFLVEKGLATLLIDLLTPEEEEVDNVTRQFRFDIPMLAKRLVGVRHWLEQQEVSCYLKVGYFGSSTGAAAALIAAAEEGHKIAAVVSRGGRADMAIPVLAQVTAATLLIVGGDDTTVLHLNEQAFAVLPEPKQIKIIPKATHLFEEPGALEQVAALAADWFIHYCR